jgi:hypothetical protein
MMCEGVCSENLLLLQIDLQGHLNHETKIYSVFKWNEITREFRVLPSEGGEGGFARSSIRDVAAADGWPGDFFFLREITLV